MVLTIISRCGYVNGKFETIRAFSPAINQSSERESLRTLIEGSILSLCHQLFTKGEVKLLTSEGRIYLDHAASTPIHPRVREAILLTLDRVGNPQSIHRDGEDMRERVEQARIQVARLIGCKPREIVFTGGGTEAINLALFGLFGQPQAHIVSTSVEHAAVLAPLRRLEQEGIRLSLVEVSGTGQVKTQQIVERLSSDTRLVSVQVANNETGVIHDLAELGRILKERGILFHLDAVQGAGLIDLNVDTLSVDLLSLSAQKMYGPQGVGALYVRQGVLLTPIIWGGRHERGRRAGTENTPGIVGFGMACELARLEREERFTHLSSLTEYLESLLLTRIPGVSISGEKVPRLPGLTHIVLPGVYGEGVVQSLDRAGFSLSHGAACSAAGSEVSHVLLAMGFSEQEAAGGLRISAGIWTKESELNKFVERLVPEVERLRNLRRRTGD